MSHLLLVFIYSPFRSASLISSQVLGLLILVGLVRVGVPGVVFFSALAVSIAVDMRLDRKPIRSKPINPGSKRNPIANYEGGPNWGPEEQRAAAGIFYISST